MDNWRSQGACKECNPLAKLPKWKLLTQAPHSAGNFWSTCEEISSLKKISSLNIFYSESFIVMKLAGEGGVVLLQSK